MLLRHETHSVGCWMLRWCWWRGWWTYECCSIFDCKYNIFIKKREHTMQGLETCLEPHFFHSFLDPFYAVETCAPLWWCLCEVLVVMAICRCYMPVASNKKSFKYGGKKRSKKAYLGTSQAPYSCQCCWCWGLSLCFQFPSLIDIVLVVVVVDDVVYCYNCYD